MCVCVCVNPIRPSTSASLLKDTGTYDLVYLMLVTNLQTNSVVYDVLNNICTSRTRAVVKVGILRYIYVKYILRVFVCVCSF